MLDNDEEVEIKIEYFDISENDPLSETVAERSDEIKGKCETEIRRCESYEVYSNHDSTQNDDSQMKCKTEINLEKKSESNGKLIQIPAEGIAKWFKSIDSSGRYICNFCDLAYSTVGTLRRHISLKHKADAGTLKTTIHNNRRTKKHTCHVCKRRFGSLQELSSHVKELHDIENIHLCHVCLAQFLTHDEKLDHLLNNHDIKLKSVYSCKTCGYQTLKLSHLNQHRNTHSQENKQKCTYCNYLTNYLPNLRIHERIHTKEFPYICDYEGCSYRSASKSGLSSHQLKHYRQENMLFCDKCGYSTVYKLSLKKHIVSHSRNSIRIK